MKSLDYVEMQAKTQLSYFYLYLKGKYKDIKVAREETGEVCLSATGDKREAYDTHQTVLDDEDKDLKSLASASVKAIYDLYLKYDGQDLANKKIARLFFDVAEK